MTEKGCSGCAHEAFDPQWGGTGQPSGEMACCNCIRNPRLDEFYKEIRGWYKWWNIRTRIFLWRNFRRSKAKDMYVILKELLKK